MIRIIIADDHDLTRRGLKQMFSEVPHISIAEEVVDGNELLNRISLFDFDLLLLDINLPGRSGLDLMKDIRRIKPDLRVLILSIYEDEHYVLNAINKGTDGYIAKSADPMELVKAIEKVARGEKYISEAMAGKILFYSKSSRVEKLHTSLTERELELLKRIASGESPREIAEKLYISVKTVHAHREHILRKMKMRSNAELILYAVKEGLI